MGKRILIVEDEGLLAYELTQQLAISGFEIMGTALSTRQAIALIEQFHCDAAVLDFKLGEETAVPVAQALEARAIKYVIVSGGSPETYGDAMPGAPHLSKPVRIAEVIAALRALTDELGSEVSADAD